MSDSSSEEENSERFKEAVWSFQSQDIKINGKDGGSKRQSHRADVSKHEHDGNELGTTPEFRSHVANKLGALLDGCISEACSALKPCESENIDEEEDEGFRLFSTSTPGKWIEQPPPPPPKRRPIPSSSDSDSEMEVRFREAAVSISDLLAASAQTLTEETNRGTEAKGENDNTVDTAPKKKRKKKKKRKITTEASEEKAMDVSKEQSHQEGTCDQLIPTKKKKKKKKKTNSEDVE